MVQMLLRASAVSPTTTGATTAAAATAATTAVDLRSASSSLSISSNADANAKSVASKGGSGFGINNRMRGRNMNDMISKEAFTMTGLTLESNSMENGESTDSTVEVSRPTSLVETKEGRKYGNRPESGRESEGGGGGGRVDRKEKDYQNISLVAEMSGGLDKTSKRDGSSRRKTLKASDYGSLSLENQFSARSSRRRITTDSYMDYVESYLAQSTVKLSHATIKAVQASWRNIPSIGFDHLGHLLFSYWLLDQPRVLEMFSVYYHGTKKAAIPLLPRFRRLGEIYAKRISVWVAGLSDPTKLFLILYEHGFNHAKRGVAEKDFLDMQPSLMDALATALGQKMTFKLYDQWKSFFKLVFEQIFEGMRGYSSDAALHSHGNPGPEQK